MKNSLIVKVLIATLLINFNLNCAGPNKPLGSADVVLGVIGGTLAITALTLNVSNITGIVKQELANKQVNNRMQKVISEAIKEFPYTKDWKQIELAIRKKDLVALKKVLNPSDPEFSKKINSPLFFPLEPIKLDFQKLKAIFSGFRSLKATGITFTYIATPLLYAIKENFTEGAEYLIDNGANVNDSIKPIDLNITISGSKVVSSDDWISGFTPLHFAAGNGNEELAELLIVKGADVNAKSFRNLTPLHLTIKHSQPELFKLLLEKGADPNVKDRENKTPLEFLEWAISDKRKKIEKYAKEYGAKS